MGMRFRKSIKIAPGVRVNLGKKGVGLSAGVKGARVSINSSGRRTRSIGIPGTGVYYTSSSSGSRASRSSASLDTAVVENEEADDDFCAFPDPSDLRGLAKRAKANITIMTVFLPLLSVLLLLLSIIYPVCLLLVAACIYFLIRLRRSGKQTICKYNDLADVLEPVQPEIDRISKDNLELNEANEPVSYFLVYDHICDDIMSLWSKAPSLFEFKSSQESEDFIHETLSPKTQDILESSYQKLRSHIATLKTEKGMNSAFSHFKNVFESNSGKLLPAQQANFESYLSEIEKAISEMSGSCK